MSRKTGRRHDPAHSVPYGVIAECRHCQVKKSISRPRGLCWQCYYIPGLREQYPSGSKFAKRGIALKNQAGLLPPHPTEAVPGSEEKIAIMAARVEAGYLPFHPDDRELTK